MMTNSVQAALELLVIAYPLVFVVMALFAAITYGLVKLSPVSPDGVPAGSKRKR